MGLATIVLNVARLLSQSSINHTYIERDVTNPPKDEALNKT